MNIIFLSSLFSKEILKKVETNTIGNIQYASNTLQWNLLLGFIENTNNIVDVVSAPMLGSYPAFYRKLSIPRLSFGEENNFKGISVSYLNIPILKNKLIYIKLKNELLKLIENRKGGEYIIVYGIYMSYIKAAIYIKKKFPHVKIILIVPDLPEYMSNSNGMLWSVRKLLKDDWLPLVSQFDCYVLLSDAMSGYLNVKSKPWVRIEGMINPLEHSRFIKKTNSDKNIIMYSGTLARRYGIVNLLAAFELIKDTSYELWICGSGNSEDMIREKMKNDSRIKFYGLLRRNNALNMQRKAKVLINPRTSEGEYTKYSFPSKIMEYLLSGTPVIMYKLPSIPKEYDKHVFYIEKESVDDMKNKIIEVCSFSNSYPRKKGKEAHNFVFENKNIKIQTKNILNLITK